MKKKIIEASEQENYHELNRLLYQEGATHEDIRQAVIDTARNPDQTGVNMLLQEAEPVHVNEAWIDEVYYTIILVRIFNQNNGPRNVGEDILQITQEAINIAQALIAERNLEEIREYLSEAFNNNDQRAITIVATLAFIGQENNDEFNQGFMNAGEQGMLNANQYLIAQLDIIESLNIFYNEFANNIAAIANENAAEITPLDVTAAVTNEEDEKELSGETEQSSE